MHIKLGYKICKGVSLLHLDTSPTKMEDSRHRQSGTLDRTTLELNRLQARNKELEKEIDSLKENTIVESMNDMKNSYKELIKENVELHEKLLQLEGSNLQKDVEALTKKANIYAKVIKKLKKKGQKVLNTNEVVERAIRNLADSDGEIEIHEIMLDGIFAVLQAANDTLESYIGHEIVHDLDCARGKCKGCYRCCCSSDVDLLDE